MSQVYPERQDHVRLYRKKSTHIGKLINVLDLFIYTLRNLSVEPVIFLVFLGYIFGGVLQSPKLYRRICELYNGEGDRAKVDCNSITDDEDENDVQMRNAEWSLFCALAYFIPAIFADTLLGAYGDRSGRKVNMMVGIAGIMVSEFGYLLVLSNSVHAPFWSALFFCFISGATGFITMIPVSCYAYLADITDDSNVLTIRSGIFAVFQSLASVIGALVAGVVSKLKVVIAIDIELGMYCLAFLYVLWRIPQKPRSSIKERQDSQRSSEDSKEIEGFFKEIWSLLKEGFHTYTAPRVGHRRAFVFITVAALMISNATNVETRISLVMNSYLFRETADDALAWSQKEVGYWNAEGYASLIVGTLLGLYLFKQIFRLRETTIILIGLGSSIARTVVIGFATEWWYMYVANALGLFAGLIQPAVMSFVVQIIPNKEVGRIFSLFGIGNDFAFIITYLVYSNVYRSTQAWKPGFLFLFISGVQALAWAGMVWVHVQTIFEKVETRKRWPQQTRDLQIAILRIGEKNPPPPPARPILTPTPFTIPEFAMAKRAADEEARVTDDEWWHSVDDFRHITGSYV